MPTRTPTVNMDGYVALTCSRRSGLDLDPEALKGCKVSKVKMSGFAFTDYDSDLRLSRFHATVGYCRAAT